MNALEYLIQEHTTHRNLINAIPAEHQRFKELREELVHHVNVEEAIFYPNLLKVSELEPIVRVAWEEHNLIMQLIQELDQLDPEDSQWEAKFNVLSKLILTHHEDEEHKLFKEIERLASAEILDEVGQQMILQKQHTFTEEILYPKVPGSHRTPTL